AAVVELAELINRQRAAQGGDRPIKTINIGGGMPAGTDPEASLDIMQRYADLIDRNVPGFGANRYGLITEFGQWIHKHNGIVYSRVEYVKKLAQKSIAYVHVGADLFMREAYTGMHSLEFVCLTEQGEELKTD